MLYGIDDGGKSYRESITKLNGHELAETFVKLSGSFNGNAERTDMLNNDERSLQSVFDEMGARYKQNQLGDDVYANKIVSALGQLNNEEAMDLNVIAYAVKDIKVPRQVPVEKQRPNPFVYNKGFPRY